MSSSQLNKLKSEVKHGTKVTLNLSSNVMGNSNDDTNFRHKLLLTNTIVFIILEFWAFAKLFQITHQSV